MHPLSMQSKIKRFTVLDALLILLFFCCAGAYFPFMQSHEPDTVVVFKDNKIIARYPLSQEVEFTIHGLIGPIKVAVHNGRVSVLEATCPERLCVRTHPISKTSQQIICEPNHVALEIDSMRGDSLDATTK
jgi:hypothetical protein